MTEGGFTEADVEHDRKDFAINGVCADMCALMSPPTAQSFLTECALSPPPNCR